MNRNIVQSQPGQNPDFLLRPFLAVRLRWSLNDWQIGIGCAFQSNGVN